VSGSLFDADDAVVTWENLLTGRRRKHEATIDDPRMVADWVNDGSAPHSAFWSAWRGWLARPLGQAAVSTAG
jgi:hypothetical protein